MGHQSATGTPLAPRLSCTHKAIHTPSHHPPTPFSACIADDTPLLSQIGACVGSLVQPPDGRVNGRPCYWYRKARTRKRKRATEAIRDPVSRLKAYLPGAEATVIKKAVPPGRGSSIALRSS